MHIPCLHTLADIQYLNTVSSETDFTTLKMKTLSHDVKPWSLSGMRSMIFISSQILHRYMTRPWTILLVLLPFIYSCSKYTRHSDRRSGITIQTIGPRGGEYTDTTGKVFGYRIFRSRIFNDTIIPVELTINFSNAAIVLPPTDSMPSFDIPKSDRYISVFLFPHYMIPGKPEEVYNYGITGLESFLDTGLIEPTMQKITIQPKQDYFLYIGALLFPSSESARSELFINGQNLVYKIVLAPPLDSTFIPCGQIIFKK